MTQPTFPKVAVAARVSPELKDELLAGAEAHGMNPSRYTGMVLAQAAIRFDELEQLRQESREKLDLLEQTEERLRKLEEQFSWFEGPLRQQVEQVVHNHQVLEWLYATHGTGPILLKEALEIGFSVNHWLVTSTHERLLYCCMGKYGWRYQDDKRTHILLHYYGAR